jgi:hypothetical protein
LPSHLRVPSKYPRVGVDGLLLRRGELEMESDGEPLAHVWAYITYSGYSGRFSRVECARRAPRMKLPGDPGSRLRWAQKTIRGHRAKLGKTPEKEYG